MKKNIKVNYKSIFKYDDHHETVQFKSDGIYEKGFDKEKFEYNISVPGNIIDLDINPTVQREGIIVETFGEKNLKEGENLVEIILTSQADSSIQTRYNIRVNKESIKEVNASVSKKDETWKIIVLIILITILLAELALYLYLLKRKKR